MTIFRIYVSYSHNVYCVIISQCYCVIISQCLYCHYYSATVLHCVGATVLLFQNITMFLFYNVIVQVLLCHSIMCAVTVLHHYIILCYCVTSLCLHNKNIPLVNISGTDKPYQTLISNVLLYDTNKQNT